MMNKINYSGYRFPPEIIPGKHTWEIEQVKFLSVEPRGPVWVDAVEKCLPQITCCAGERFQLVSGWVLSGDLAWIAMPLRNRRAHPTFWWAE